MPVVTDKSGIYSLGGFAYQIKVFVCYALILEEGMQAGFETLEDVTIRKLVPENIDENEDKFRSLFVSPSGISAIQVKRTAVDKSTAKQTLLNWILLEGTKSDIVEYVLFTDQSYNNGDIIFNITVDELFAEVVATKLTTKSTIGKVKKLYKKIRQMCKAVGMELEEHRSSFIVYAVLSVHFCKICFPIVPRIDYFVQSIWLRPEMNSKDSRCQTKYAVNHVLIPYGGTIQALKNEKQLLYQYRLVFLKDTFALLDNSPDRPYEQLSLLSEGNFPIL